MTTTPEGRIKKKIKEVMNKYGSSIYSHWPVQTGYGAATLDCLGCVNGWWFAVEAKAPGQRPTIRQREIMRRIGVAGGMVFIIDGEDSLREFELWLAQRIPVWTAASS